MPFCTIEEAWGENIYKTEQNNNLHNEDVVYTDMIKPITSQYTKPGSINNVNNDTNDTNDTNDNNITTNNEKLDMDFIKFIDKLRKENDELKKIISNYSLEADNNKHLFKFKVIDIIIYILTGIFIIFMIDIILKYNNVKPIVQEHMF